MNQGQRTDIWNSLLDAEMNEIYWSCEAQRYSSQDRNMTVAVAAMSSATVLGLFSPFPLAGKILAVIASMASIVHATFFSKVRVKQIAELASSYKELAIELKLLWSQVQTNCEDDAKRWREYEALARREKKIDESAFTISQNRMMSSQEQVCRARGLPYERKRAKVTTTTAAATTISSE